MVGLNGPAINEIWTKVTGSNAGDVGPQLCQLVVTSLEVEPEHAGLYAEGVGLEQKGADEDQSSLHQKIHRIVCPVITLRVVSLVKLWACQSGNKELGLFHRCFFLEILKYYLWSPYCFLHRLCQ